MTGKTETDLEAKSITESAPTAVPSVGVVDSEDRTLEHLTKELLESLRQTAWIFEHESGGRWEGPKQACHAVADFIRRLGGSPEIVTHLMATMKGFEDLQRGVQPALFSVNPQLSERDRSSERKWNIKWAAAILDILVEGGEGEDASATRIARAANEWPGFATQEISRHTIKNWRKSWIAATPADRGDFDKLCEALRSDQQAKSIIENVLKRGPPGMPKS